MLTSQAAQVTPIEIYSHFVGPKQNEPIAVISADVSTRDLREGLSFGGPAQAVLDTESLRALSYDVGHRETRIRRSSNVYEVSQTPAYSGHRNSRFLLFRMDSSPDLRGGPGFEMVSPDSPARWGNLAIGFHEDAQFEIGPGHYVMVAPHDHDRFVGEMSWGFRSDYLSRGSMVMTLPPLTNGPRDSTDVQRDIIYSILSRVRLETLRTIFRELGFSRQETAEPKNRQKLVGDFMRSMTTDDSEIARALDVIYKELGYRSPADVNKFFRHYPLLTWQ